MESSEQNRDKESILQQLATSNTFDTDWPTLRGYFQSSLDDALKLFISKGPPRPYRPPGEHSVVLAKTETSSPAIGPAEEGRPATESLLLSPSRNVDKPDSAGSDDLQPSTLGGLVLPPFPPSDRSRRRTPSPAPVPTSRSPSHGLSPRANGVQNQMTASMNVGAPEEDWDEDTVIGGKKMVGWMEEAHGRREVDRLSKLLDEISEPPFTIQRLAELVLHPTTQHSTLGKFLRSVERSLLVTTAWQAPSYVYVPPASFNRPGLASMGTVSGEPAGWGDSTVPEGSTTPLFSPIPFLVHGAGSSNETNTSMGDIGMEGTMEEGMVSPLMLSDEQTHAISSSGRSPTPEPENTESNKSNAQDEDADMPSASSDPDEVPQPETALGHSDPSNTPYLGRVDELDTGPLPSGGEEPARKRRASIQSSKDEATPMPVAVAQGESGSLVSHGMSEKPVPISSTTVVKEEGVEGRQMRSLRRTTSEKSLGDRFVSGGVQKPEETAIVDEGSAEDMDSKPKEELTTET